MSTVAVLETSLAKIARSILRQRMKQMSDRLYRGRKMCIPRDTQFVSVGSVTHSKLSFLSMVISFCPPLGSESLSSQPVGKYVELELGCRNRPLPYLMNIYNQPIALKC